MKQIFYSLMALAILVTFACKRDDNNAPNYGEFSRPAFEVYQEPGNLEHLFAKCLTEDVYLDTVIVTNNMPMTYNKYFQGQLYLKDQEIDLGETFVPYHGDWNFIFKGTKRVSGVRFSTPHQHKF